MLDFERALRRDFWERRADCGGVADAFPVFNQKYGQELPGGTYQVPAPWQSGLSNVCLCKPSWL